MKSVPRSEHPRPDRRRSDYLILNGEWEFEIDNARVGKERRYFERKSLDSRITLPFCPESSLSGLSHTDFMNALWYRRSMTVPEEFSGKRILFHIDACDYECELYINGILAGTHKGGYTPICHDITELLCEGENSVCIYAADDLRSGKQVAGKQSKELFSHGCFYTRHTGIWQTVWLEAAEAARVVSYRAEPSASADGCMLEIKLTPEAVGGTLGAYAEWNGKEVGVISGKRITSRVMHIALPLSEMHMWQVGKGGLYRLKLSVAKNGRRDVLEGYFGLRTVSLANGRMLINGEPVFGRFVLDQGYYPDGIVTAPTDEALYRDIEYALACGFNGARLHQKVFEPRFLYHADRLGYMVFDECGNWGLDLTDPESIYDFLPEWIEEMERDIAHPSVIGWCPFNETWDINNRERDLRLIDTVYSVTRAIDSTRIVIADSGSFPPSESDAHDIHDYEQDPERFASYYNNIDSGEVNDQLKRIHPTRQHYKCGMPIFMSEWGGIKWIIDSDKNGCGWGYGEDVKSEDEFFARLEGLANVIYRNPHFFAACYTQLYDIEQEQNGFMTYDRRFKFPPEKLKAVISRPSVTEEQSG